MENIIAFGAERKKNRKMKIKNCYRIDTIYDRDFHETYYYVYHEHSDGHRDIVFRYFRSYASAEVLRDELNDDLYDEEEQ